MYIEYYIKILHFYVYYLYVLRVWQGGDSLCIASLKSAALYHITTPIVTLYGSLGITDYYK